MNVFQRALRDFQDSAEDVSRSRYNTVSDALRRVAASIVPGTPLGDVAGTLPSVEFDRWYEQQLQGARGMGSEELEWPLDRYEKLALQVALIRQLAAGAVDVHDFAVNFTRVSSRLDDNLGEFVEQVFRPFVRDFLRHAHDTPQFAEGLRRDRTDPLEGTTMAHDLILFISHSSADVGIARALIILFEKALKVSARNIRCTSVDGYRLPVGADTDEALRAEVFGAKVFLALLTPSSLASDYVLFELGARWGARRPLYPLLAAGCTPEDLRPPLNGLNALSASVRDQLRQLLEDASAALSIRLEPMASYSVELDAVVAASDGT